MTTPASYPPRPSTGRSSFAVAMKDYTFVRPGIAVTISAVTLTLSLVIGLWLIFSLSEAAETVSRGARTSEPLHLYNAGLEVWRQRATGTDPDSAGSRPWRSATVWDDGCASSSRLS